VALLKGLGDPEIIWVDFSRGKPCSSVQEKMFSFRLVLLCPTETAQCFLHVHFLITS